MRLLRFFSGEKRAVQDEAEIRWLGDLQRVELKPGDLLVLKHPARLSAVAAQRLSEKLREVLPAGTHVAVLEEGLEIGVLGPEA